MCLACTAGRAGGAALGEGEGVVFGSLTRQALLHVDANVGNTNVVKGFEKVDRPGPRPCVPVDHERDHLVPANLVFRLFLAWKRLSEGGHLCGIPRSLSASMYPSTRPNLYENQIAAKRSGVSVHRPRQDA